MNTHSYILVTTFPPRAQTSCKACEACEATCSPASMLLLHPRPVDSVAALVPEPAAPSSRSCPHGSGSSQLSTDSFVSGRNDPSLPPCLLSPLRLATLCSVKTFASRACQIGPSGRALHPLSPAEFWSLHTPPSPSICRRRRGILSSGCPRAPGALSSTPDTPPCPQESSGSPHCSSVFGLFPCIRSSWPASVAPDPCRRR
jgi:hypothetical protein